MAKDPRVKQVEYWELAKHTFPKRGDTTRFSSVEYVLRTRKRIQTQGVTGNNDLAPFDLQNVSSSITT